MNTSLAKLLSSLLSIKFSHKSNKENLYKKELFYFLKAKSGVYNKFLQVLCITHKFMEGWSGAKEYAVYNQAESEFIDLKDVIPHYDEYKEITNNPIAVGSFAQVYKAITKDDRTIALKVLKPSIKKNLRKDLKFLKRLVRVVSLFIPASFLDYNAAIEEFNEICITETDYEREIYNLKYFNDLYKNHKYVVIPEVYEDLSSRYVIAQEFIEGVTLSDILTDLKKDENLFIKAKNLTGSNIYTQLTIVGGELLRCAMTQEFTYGDPHPGNIILLKDNKVAYIDFGIVGSHPLSQRAFHDWTKSYYNFLTNNSSMKEFEGLVDTTFQCFCPDFINALNLCTDNRIITIISSSLSEKLDNKSRTDSELNKLISDGHMFKVFTKFMNNKNVFHLSMDMRNFPLLKAMQAYICTVSAIDKRHAKNTFTKIMIYAMEYAFDYLKSEEVPYDYVENTRYSKGDALELIDEMLASLAEGDELLFKNIYKEMM